MYHGEVNVAQEELNSFLAVAEDLQVKGLTQNSSDPDIQPGKQKEAQEEKPPRQPIHASPPPPIVVKVVEPVFLEQDDDDMQVMPMVKTEPEQISFTSTEVTTMQESYNMDKGDDYAGAMAEEEQGYEGHYQEGIGSKGKGSIQILKFVHQMLLLHDILYSFKKC